MGIVRGYCRRSSGIVKFWFRRLGRRLRLDRQQQEKLTALQDKMLEARTERHQHQRAWRNDIENLLSAESLDQQEALRLLQLPRGLKQDKLAELVASFAEFFNSLDPQQHQRMQKMWRKLHRYSGAHPA